VTLNVTEMPVRSIPGTAVVRIRNPYVAAAYGLLAKRSINPPVASLLAVNRLSWLPKFGPPYAVVCADASLEKVDMRGPWLLLTAWRLNLDGPVTSMEGAKSVLEHRAYMRNPLARVTVIAPRPSRMLSVFATINSARGLVADALSHLGLLYARVTLGDYNGDMRVIDIDPVPPVESREEAELIAGLV